LACYGFSMGAAESPRLIALEQRIKAGLLFYGGAYEREWPAEVDPFNFAPRVSVPILMVDGKFDVIFSLEASQIPLFQALGTPPQNKKHYLVDAGHGGLNKEIISDTLEWLDNYLGPVRIR
jgi:dienelactone hydrolase